MFKKLWSLLNALRWCIRCMRLEGISFRQVVQVAFRELPNGRKSFIHKLMAYASGGSKNTPHPVGTDETDYIYWLKRQPRIPAPPITDLISIIMPVCNTPEHFLREVVASIEAQTCCNWELCVHDDASDAPHVHRVLCELQARIPNMKVSSSSTRTGIAAATNAALGMAAGHWIAFVDHDDLLEPDAIAAVIECHERTGADIVYTDHDVLGDDGVLRHPYFKPDWNHDLFLSQMYLGHLVSFRRKLVEELGGLRSKLDGSQDYDLVLRCVAAGARIAHIPKVLYHWRAHVGSTAASADSKPYAHDAGKLAIQHHVDLLHPGASVRDGQNLFCYDVRYPYAEHDPFVSIIIPTRDSLDLLKVAITTLIDVTRYPYYEIIIIDNGSIDSRTLTWLEQMSAKPNFSVVRADTPFNWSRLNNLGAKQARGDVFVFLNNDVEVTDGEWLQRLAENALRPEVAVCGPMLLYSDGSIQHAGVVVGMGGWADHVYKGEWPVHSQNLFASPVLRRQVLAVTGACMVIARAKFELLGGFDESFIVCGSDVELCLRAFDKGYRTVYVPEARMIHHESKTRDPRAIPEGDFVRSAEAYAPFREEGDPFYSPNLDYMSCSPRFREDLV